MDDKKIRSLDDNELNAVVGGTASGVVDRDIETGGSIDMSLLTGEESDSESFGLDQEEPGMPKRKSKDKPGRITKC